MANRRAIRFLSFAASLALLNSGCGGGSTTSAAGVRGDIKGSTVVTEAATTTTTIPAFTKEIASSDGWRYRVSAIGFRSDPSPSPGGCYQSPPPAQTNLWFQLEIENLISDRTAPIPSLVLGLNLDDAGQHVTSATTVEGSYEKLEVSPQAESVPCFLSFGTSSGFGRNRMSSMRQTFTAVVSAIPNPPPAGLVLLIRFNDETNYSSVDWTVPATP